jgi:hypothetical protein
MLTLARDEHALALQVAGEHGEDGEGGGLGGEDRRGPRRGGRRPVEVGGEKD